MSFDRPLLNSDSTEQELAKILDELNANPLGSGLEPCWLDSPEFVNLVCRAASMGEAQMEKLKEAIRANVGRIRA